jgi:hypothetical protein
VTAAIVAFGIFVFTLAVKYLPIFRHEAPAPERVAERVAPPGALPVAR